MPDNFTHNGEALQYNKFKMFFWVFFQGVLRYYSGADPGRGESGSSHGQIFSTLEYFALTFLKILD